MVFAQRDEHPVKVQETCISFQCDGVIAPSYASMAILVKLSVVRQYRLGGNYLLVSLSFLFFTANVMFSHLSVILFTGGGLCPGRRGSLSKSKRGRVSVQGGLCQGDLPTYSNVRVLCILPECILV